MSSYIRDPVGTGVAVLIGVALGVTLAGPMLPQFLPIDVNVSTSRITALLVLGTVALVAIPVGSFLLYLLFSPTDR